MNDQYDQVLNQLVFFSVPDISGDGGSQNN